MSTLKTMAIAAIAASAISMPAHAAINLITNGGFEAGPAAGVFVTLGFGDSSITGWTVTGGSVDYIGTYWNGHDGTHSLDLAGNAPGSIAQTISGLTIGQNYAVKYWLSANPDGGLSPRNGALTITQGLTSDVRPFSFTGPVGRDGSGNIHYALDVKYFKATATSATLTFSADPATSGGFFGAALDDVSVSPTPEPEAYASMLVGLGLAGLVARRRARKAKGSQTA